MPVTPHPDGALLDVRVQPRASRSEILGLRDGALRVRLTAPPVDGAANAALIEVLSKRLGLRKADLEIVSGAHGRQKRVLARGLTVEEAARRLGLADEPL